MNDKQQVARHAASLIEDGMVIGLGTGSTANYFIEYLALRCREEALNIKVVASSVITAIKAYDLGLPMLSLEQISKLDLYVDGADEVTADMTLLKGRGIDLVKEKLLAKASDAFWVLIDKSKQVNRIGDNFPIPVEVMPFAWRLVQTSIIEIGGYCTVRALADNMAISAHGSLVLDAVFANNHDIQSLNQQLSLLPGVVEHGIFCGLSTAVFCGQEGQIIEQWR